MPFGDIRAGLTVEFLTMDLLVSDVRTVDMNTSWHFLVSVVISAHPWPRPGLLCQLQGIVS